MRCQQKAVNSMPPNTCSSVWTGGLADEPKRPGWAAAAEEESAAAAAAEADAARLRAEEEAVAESIGVAARLDRERVQRRPLARPSTASVAKTSASTFRCIRG